MGSVFDAAVGKDGTLFYTVSADSSVHEGFSNAIPVLGPSFAPAGAGVATGIQSGNQFDIFVVDNFGRLTVAWSANFDPFQSSALTSNEFAPPGAHLATGTQANNQLDVFVVGNDGAVYVLWEAQNGGWTQPIALTPVGFAPAGAGLATGRQANDQLDVFVVGNDGILYVLWEANNGGWSQPLPLTDREFAPHGAYLATGSQSTLNEHNSQLDVFVIGNDGALSVLWEVNNGGWNGPSAITQPHYLPPGGGFGVFLQKLQGDPPSHQLDVAFVAPDGSLSVIWEVDNGGWSAPAPISTPGLALPGAPVSGTLFDTTLFAAVLVPTVDQTLVQYEVFGVGDGWSGPHQLTAAGYMSERANSSISVLKTEPPHNSVDIVPFITFIFSILDGPKDPKTLARIRWEAGDHDQGVARALESVAMARELVFEDVKYRPMLAQRLLDPAGLYLGLVGRAAEAAQLDAESAQIYASLANADPATHDNRFQQAQALIAQAQQLFAANQPADAIARAQDAVAILRTLAPDSDAYLGALGNCLLYPLTGFLISTQRWDEAIAAAREGSAAFQQLATTDPNQPVHRYDLARANIQLGQAWWGKGDLTQAFDRIEAALAIARKLVAEDVSYRGALGEWLLYPMTTFLMVQQRWDEAIAAGGEALTVFEQLAAAEPNVPGHRYDTGRAQIEVGEAWWGKPDPTRAIDHVQAAIAIIRRLITDNPTYRYALAQWLEFPLSAYLQATGRRADAIAAESEAVDILTVLAAADPDHYTTRLAAARRRLADLRAGA
ncbi:tetratricopeptide repeat protein [Nocardia arthritidis]|uniref:PLL-like beta propeller domain-containing protein n=1 Tax=Nocardia arthritidis TaxID=228602 RepID=A0A6G9Y950_9NOCA|nr:tetratricopeptide repeat protein [Nocardia arthritidis]QIS09741.1 hypothetical protein F5544_09200 [Nocardia arthritidis]